jgi:hypothetical protein
VLLSPRLQVFEQGAMNSNNNNQSTASSHKKGKRPATRTMRPPPNEGTSNNNHNINNNNAATVGRRRAKMRYVSRGHVKVSNAVGIVSNFIHPSSSGIEGIEGIATDVDNNVGLGQEEHGPRAVANGDDNNNNLQAKHTQVSVC